ncbi:MAG TPA: PspC domain-containing protein [Allosphingosinicella sp.]
MKTVFSVMARDDTMLGACFAISEDLGIDPLWMRVGFAAILFWSPAAALAGYGLALVLAILARLVVPEPVIPAAAAAAAEKEPAPEAERAEDLQLAA